MDLCTMRRDLGVGEEAGLRYGKTRDLATAAYVTQARGRKGKEGRGQQQTTTTILKIAARSLNTLALPNNSATHARNLPPCVLSGSR